MTKKLNIGCGDIKMEGYLNLDWNKAKNPDVIWDLNKFPYPFKDQEFDAINCSHILEHVVNFDKVFAELLRILKDDGVLHIRVPHFTCGTGYNDLTHKRFFGWFTFKLMEAGVFNKDYKFRIISQRYNLFGQRQEFLNLLTSWIPNYLYHKVIYERFFCWIFPMYEIELFIGKKNYNEHKTPNI